MGAYSIDEVQALGERGLALLMKDGKYLWPIANGRDVTNAWLALQKTERPSEREGAEQTVRSWVIERATRLRVLHLLPKGVAEPVKKLHPNELGPTGPVGAVNVPAPGGGGAGASEGGSMSGSGMV
jgi:hypothetical protein